MPSITIAAPTGRARQKGNERRRWRLVGAVAAFVILAGATVEAILLHRQTMRASAPAPATLIVTSVPSDAVVQVDGKYRGHTPAQLAVAPGDHHLTFQGPRVMPDTVDARAVANRSTDVQATLWLRTPAVEQIRPPFPGASITNAAFLDDGRVVLTVALPPGNEHQLWIRTHDSGLQRVGPPAAYGALAPSPDGHQVAYLATNAAAPSAFSVLALRLTTVRIAASDGQHDMQRYALTANADDQLTDLAWSPDGSHLLIVSQHRASDGGSRTRLNSLDVNRGDIRTLVDLPSGIVPGSFLWAPHGDAVAFLTQAGPLVSLCLVGTTAPSFRYLTDLGQNEPHPVPVPPLAWSPDGNNLVYAAPIQTRSTSLAGRLFGTRTTPAVFATTVDDTSSRRLGTAQGNAPVWRVDGSLLALAQTNGSGPLRLEIVNPGNGAATPVGTLPLPAIATYAVRWDAAHGQALLAQRGDTGTTTFWLLSFTPEVAR